MVVKTRKINALLIFSEHGAKLQHLKYMHLQPISYQSSEWVVNKNSLFRSPVPSLPAIDVCPQLAQTFRCLGICLLVLVAVPSGVTCLARRAHQILGYCWPRRLLAAAAAQRDRQNRT